MALRIHNLAGTRIFAPQDFTFAETSQRAAPTTFTGGISTFADMDLGVPEISRRMILLIGSRVDFSINGVAIGGITATSHVGVARTVTTPDIRVAIYSAFVPSGRFGDVAIDYGANLDSVQCVLFRATRIKATAFDTGSANQTTNVGTNLSIPTKGLIIGACVQNQLTGSAGATWSGMTERDHFDNNGSSNCSLSYAWNTLQNAETDKFISVTGGSTERALALASFELDAP